MSDQAPKPNGGNGAGAERDAGGRFVPGNQAAKGRKHPIAARVTELKAVVQDALTDNRVESVMTAMIAKACKGDVAAARLLLEYGIGPANKLELNVGVGIDGPQKRIIVVNDLNNGWGKLVSPSISGEQDESEQYVDLLPAELAQADPADSPETPAEDSQRTTKPQGENVGADDGDTYDSDQSDRAADRAAQPPDSGDSDARDEPDTEGPAPDPFEGLADHERRFIDPDYNPDHPEHGDSNP